MEISELILQESEVEEVIWMDAIRCLENVRSGAFLNCIEEEELLMLCACLFEKGGKSHDRDTWA